MPVLNPAEFHLQPHQCAGVTGCAYRVPGLPVPYGRADNPPNGTLRRPELLLVRQPPPETIPPVCLRFARLPSRPQQSLQRPLLRRAVPVLHRGIGLVIRAVGGRLRMRTGCQPEPFAIPTLLPVVTHLALLRVNLPPSVFCSIWTDDCIPQCRHWYHISDPRSPRRCFSPPHQLQAVLLPAIARAPPLA